MFRVVFTASAFVLLIGVATWSGANNQSPAVVGPGFSPANSSWIDPHRSNADRLITEAQANHFAWNRLAELTDTYGNRLSGSENLTRAIAWAVETMKKDGLENVHTERVMIPKWVRGTESLEITNPPHHVVPMLGLGGSVATPPAEIGRASCRERG